jgi:hypothetical protein
MKTIKKSKINRPECPYLLLGCGQQRESFSSKMRMVHKPFLSTKLFPHSTITEEQDLSTSLAGLKT